MIDEDFIDILLKRANENSRKRENFDMRTTPEDSSQRMLNALLQETVVPIHRHPNSTEDVIIIQGKLDEIIYKKYNNQLIEIKRIHLCPAEYNFGCQIPKGAWHSVEVFEPSVIYEGKDGKYGEDGSEIWHK